MGRQYLAIVEEVAVTTAVDLVELVAPADAILKLHSLHVSQSSDAGDSEDEMLNILFHLGSTSGSGGTTPTASPNELGDPAFGGTLEMMNTTQSTEGVFRWAESWNIRQGFIWLPTPTFQGIISPSDRFIAELQTAPADSLTMSVVLEFEEIGG